VTLGTTPLYNYKQAIYEHEQQPTAILIFTSKACVSFNQLQYNSLSMSIESKYSHSLALSLFLTLKTGH
jgi:hypothetical protein